MDEVTIITKTNGDWTRLDETLIAQIGCYGITRDSKFPNILVIDGNCPREKLEKALKTTSFKHVVTFSKDPKLPFKVL